MVRSQLRMTWPRQMLLAALALGGAQSGRAEEAAQPGATQVARWKDGKQAAFLLMFDDSSPTHVKNVVPELKKRGLTGTFYINPGAGHYKASKDAWEKEFPAAGMEYANHSLTHTGARDVAHFDGELAACNEVIAKAFPDRKMPRLISFGKPGVKPEQWRISDAELRELLAKHHLVDRPTFDGHGAAIHFKTGADMLKLVDRALAKGTMECIIFHGVGGDWISMPLPDFIALLDGLAARKDQLWVTDHISAHQYETERSSAEVKVVEAGVKQVRLTLSCKAAPEFYDLPLTLNTQVPAAWRQCQITQGGRKQTAAAQGVVQYAAVPGGDEIVIQPLSP